MAVPIEQRSATYPGGQRRATQEGWVLLSYVVSAAGEAIEPIVIDSSGGFRFEREVKSAVGDWRFEEISSGEELPYNVTNSRFTILGRGKGTSRKFARHHRHIMTNIRADKIDVARTQAEEALSQGGWSLYESTILWLMIGRIEGAAGNDQANLGAYRRALAVSNERSLSRGARITLIEDIFDLQSKLGHYAAAMQSAQTLQSISRDHPVVQTVTAKALVVQQTMEAREITTARAEINTPCACEDGTPIWTYKPARRTFSFDNLHGNVERFEARCEQQRMMDTVITGQQWTLPDDWGYCQVFVFGDEGATFDFLGHVKPPSPPSDVNTPTARNHVLDRRN